MKHGRIDENQRQIVKTLRAVGASVQSLADLGKGVPDLLVYFHGYFLLEIKRDKKAKLTEREDEWHTEWRGPVSVVTSPDEALHVIGANKNWVHRDGRTGTR